jgi:hypothetical protein
MYTLSQHDAMLRPVSCVQSLSRSFDIILRANNVVLPNPFLGNFSFNKEGRVPHPCALCKGAVLGFQYVGQVPTLSQPREWLDYPPESSHFAVVTQFGSGGRKRLPALKTGGLYKTQQPPKRTVL